MGQMLTFKCIKCGNEIDINEGLGMLWYSFDKSMFYKPKDNGCRLNFYEEFDEITIKNIHKFIEDSVDVIISDAYYQPYICNKCGKIESKIYFRMYGLKTNKTYRLIYTCDCGGKYRKLTNKEIEHLRCNKCGSKMIETREICWD